MGCLHRHGSRAPFQKHPDDHAGQEELNVCAESTGAMPATPAVEELAAARTQPSKDVLEVGCRGRGRSECGGIERPAGDGEQSYRDYPAPDLKATVVDVLVWNSVTRKMQWRTAGERNDPRVRQCTQRCTGGDMERDDHDRKVYIVGEDAV